MTCPYFSKQGEKPFCRTYGLIQSRTGCLDDYQRCLQEATESSNKKRQNDVALKIERREWVPDFSLTKLTRMEV